MMLLPPEQHKLEGDQGKDDDHGHLAVSALVSCMLVKVFRLVLETKKVVERLNGGRQVFR